MSRDSTAPASPAHRARALTPGPAAPEPGHRPRDLLVFLPRALPWRGAGLGPCPPALAALRAGTMPPSSGSTPPAHEQRCLPRASAAGAGKFSHLCFWEVGGKTRLHLQQCFLSLLGQSSSPRKPGQLFCRLSTQQPWRIVTSRDRGHRESKGQVCKGIRRTKDADQDTERCGSLLPLCAGTWKEPAASTFWVHKYCQALLTVTPPHQIGPGSCWERAGLRGLGTHAACLSEGGAVGQQRKEAVGPSGKTRVPR